MEKPVSRLSNWLGAVPDGRAQLTRPGFRIQGTGVTCGQTSSGPLVHRLSPSEADLVPSLASQEIASLSLWRSQAYRDYFQTLEDAGGFFYERWVSCRT